MPALATMKQADRSRRNRRLTGRPPHVEAVGEDVLALITLAQTRDAHTFATQLHLKMGQYLDDELEALATWVLSADDFEVRTPDVMGPLNRGDTEGALKAICSRMRRRFAKALRDHQRSEADEFYDGCMVE